MEKAHTGLVGIWWLLNSTSRAIAASETARLFRPYATIKALRGLVISYGIVVRGSFGEMVGKDRVEAVLIVTPHPTHRQIAVEAAEAGCHVLVEKPMALSVADCDAMIAASAAAGKSLGVIIEAAPVSQLQDVRSIASH